MVKFETKLNSQASGALNKYTMKKLWWIYALFTVLFVVLGALNLKDDTVSGIIFICIGVLFTPLCIILTKLIQKNVDKSMSIMSDETIETYTFEEDKFTVTQEKGEEFRGTTEAKYSYFNKVTETSTHFYMYLSKMQCHVVPKNALVEGTLEELENIFIKNLGPRYKKK